MVILAPFCGNLMDCMAGETIRHAWLRALGSEDLPAQITLREGPCSHLRTYKHDFFAATGLYEGPSGKVILKMGRTRRLFGLPMRWLGRLLADREFDVYQAVADLPGIPKCLGRLGDTGFVHAFVEGHPLQRNEQVNDEFFPQLEQLITELHRRDIAYVDLEKRENILVDAAGRPCLIDFQISWRWPRDRKARRTALQRIVPGLLGRFVLDKLQAADRYHLLKHRRRHRPDGLSPEELKASYRSGGYIAVHRRLFWPFTAIRRAILKALTGRSRSPKQEGPEFI